MNEEASGARDTVDTANRLHSAAIHLLRRVARRDPESGLSAARLSALSVLVFGGPVTVGGLAHAEQVSLPTISRLVQGMERDGLVERQGDDSDRRVVHLRATDRGQQILRDARARRVEDLASRLAHLSPDELDTLRRAAEILDGLSLD
jgi:DNA-binding MarR family transcriptional regulator